MYDLKLVNGNCYINGQFLSTNIYINGGKIAQISPDDYDASETYDCKGLDVLPGLIDPHVHFALDLGFISSADDFLSGTKTAAYGGFTTILDFLDPIFNNDELERAFHKRLKDAEGAFIDYGFHCTLGNYQDDPRLLKKIIKDLGISTIKVFTAYSESNRRCKDEVIKSLYGPDVMVMAHAEDDETVNSNHKDISSYESSRSTESEYIAIERLMKDKEGIDGPLYIVHTSSGENLERFVSMPHSLTKDVYFESCPQYFYLDKSLYSKEDGGKYLLAPSLRSLEENELLMANVGALSTIGTDHCPFMLKDKLASLDASKVAKGLGGIEFSYPLMYTLFDHWVLDYYTLNVAELFGLKTKGQIKVGLDADFCIFDPQVSRVVDSGVSNCDYSPFEGFEIKGQAISTILRGEFVLKNGDFIGGKGKFVRRSL